MKEVFHRGRAYDAHQQLFLHQADFQEVLRLFRLKNLPVAARNGLPVPLQ